MPYICGFYLYPNPFIFSNNFWSINNIYVTSNNEPDLETIINDIETGGHETNCDIVNDCNDDTLWSSYFMSAISTVNNFILGITENSPEKRKGE